MLEEGQPYNTDPSCIIIKKPPCGGREMGEREWEEWRIERERERLSSGIEIMK